MTDPTPLHIEPSALPPLPKSTACLWVTDNPKHCSLLRPAPNIVNAFPWPADSKTPEDRAYWCERGFWQEPLFTADQMHAYVLADRATRTAAPAVAGQQAGEDWHKNSTTLTATQLWTALQFAAPDFDTDEEQRETEVSIAWGPAGATTDDEGQPHPAGYKVWMTDYPEEGSIPLDEPLAGFPPPQVALALDTSPVPLMRSLQEWKDVEVVSRILVRAGKTVKEVRNPGITARDSIVLANYISELQGVIVSLMAAQPSPSAVSAAPRVAVCCGRSECGGECGNEWQGMEDVDPAKEISKKGNLESSAPRCPAVVANSEQLAEMEARKDAAYLERNQVVAALAKAFPSGVARTAIEGWSEDWHGCVYIDLPTGQASWHFHDSQAYLFDGLPPYVGQWDGHDTPEKYRRLAALAGPAVVATEPMDMALCEIHSVVIRPGQLYTFSRVGDCEKCAAMELAAIEGYEPIGVTPIERPLAKHLLAVPTPSVEAAGMVMVPREPTKEMLANAAKWVDFNPNGGADAWPSDIWRAMIAAAPGIGAKS